MKKIHLLAFLAAMLFIFPSCEEEDTTTPDVDLQATDIEFSAEGIDPALQDFAGTATIKGIVTNIGADRFSSGAGQQTIDLYEVPLGGTANRVASLDFTSLEAGSTLEVTYTRDWDLSSPAEGEFPPNYRLVISYDPDIQIDGNDDNNDSDATNDSLEESGQQINDMF